MFAWHGKNLVELDSFFGKITIFSQKFKKRPLKWPHFGAFLSWVVLWYAKWGEIKKKAVFVRFRRNLKKRILSIRDFKAIANRGWV